MTLAAIDDIISRGRRQNWIDLRQAALTNSAVAGKVVRVCKVHLPDPYAQRYHSFGKSHGVGLADAIIAATSQIENADLATLNTKHYPMIVRLKPAYSKK